MLLVLMYMIIVFSLNLSGVTGIAAGLIPSIALSAASWYLKKRLGREQSRGGTTDGGVMNDGQTEDNNDDTQRLLHEET